jgi:hypothetical protein
VEQEFLDLQVVVDMAPQVVQLVLGQVVLLVVQEQILVQVMEISDQRVRSLLEVVEVVLMVPLDLP